MKNYTNEHFKFWQTAKFTKYCIFYAYCTTIFFSSSRFSQTPIKKVVSAKDRTCFTCQSRATTVRYNIELISAMLRASMMISSPVSVVKELLENSLDCGASSVLIQTDSTTLAFLEVRDNGPGVKPADRILLTAPSTTSKMKSLDEELRYLGFKGEALACIADLSESPPNVKMRITTQTIEEKMGQTWLVDRSGQVVLP
jgi:hypothetical protein